MKTMQRVMATVGVAGLVLGVAGCHKAGNETVSLTGAGATFPYPLYSKWISEYRRVEPTVSINYQSIGSGGGIRQITERTVDFGASDAPMTDEELAGAQAPLIHVPTTLGAVALVANLPGVSTPVRLDGEALVGIYLGTLTQWNDPSLAALNPTITLPAQPIAVVHRSDGSGTTAVFTDYLARVSTPWRDKVGRGKSIAWPTGLGAKGNEGVMGLVKTTSFSIGYVELAYAVQSGLPILEIENQAGRFVAPTIESISAAAAGTVASMPADFRVSIVDAPGEGAYPIAAFTYLLVYADAPDARRAQALATFLHWALGEGQQYAAALHYAPLPAPVAMRVEAAVARLGKGGTAVD
ncbi:MAG: phosphate ABC transporter substrate-binding protein PstS [Myxococcota bacterium]